MIPLGAGSPIGGSQMYPRPAGNALSRAGSLPPGRPAFFEPGNIVANNTIRISEIDEILRSGVTQFSNDGTSVSHNFAELRRERRRLVEDDDTLGPLKRPRVFQADLSGF